MEAQYNTVHFIKIQCITHNPFFYSLYSFFVTVCRCSFPNHQGDRWQSKKWFILKALFSTYIYLSAVANKCFKREKVHFERTALSSWIKQDHVRCQGTEKVLLQSACLNGQFPIISYFLFLNLKSSTYQNLSCFLLRP